MKVFKDRISLARNARGCYILDTVKGCSVCKSEKPKGCYDNCYAKAIADRYGIDFANIVNRDFERDKSQLSLFGFDDTSHVNQIVKKIRNIDMPFFRIGEMGDPSEDWDHTLSVCRDIAIAGKPIVIITKHWKTIPNTLLPLVNGICINTSVSALDSESELSYRLVQFERLKPFCKSVLRVVTCDFNLENEEGYSRNNVQLALLAHGGVIETVFRPNNNNRLVTDGVIKVSKQKFLKGEVLASMRDKNTFMGFCDVCPDMCGVNL